MRLLLISPNRLRLIAPPLPLGLAAVAAAVAPEHEIRVLDFMFADDPQEELRRVVAQWPPDLVALSLRNLDNQDIRTPITYFPEYKELISLLRSLGPASILVGGAGFSIVPRELMAYLEADWGVVGEGDEALPAFLQAWGSGEVQQVPGLIWPQGDSWGFNPPRRVENLAGLPAPALKYFTPQLYQEAQGNAKLPGMVPVQTRRGCPMRCTYCTTPRLEGRHIRAWPPEVVAAWLRDWHQRWDLSRFYFVDNIFNHPVDYARRLCQAIMELNLPLEWGCLINPAFPDRELFRLIRRAGGTMVQVGNESGSDLMLSNLGKGFDREKVELTLRLLQEEGLPYSCFLLMGSPGETPETVKESVALLEKYQPQMVNLTVGVRIHPGLPIHRQALAEGVVSPRDNLLWPHFYLAPAIKDWIWGYLEELTARQPHWIF